MLEEQLNGLYEQYGYHKFRMSKFEDYDLYAQNKDFLKSGHIITFTDVDGELKALKPDITLSIMKNNNGSSEKVYYNENVYRDMGGTFKEILQVGVESVGQLDPYAEAEVIALAAKSLELLSEDCVLDLSDVSFVSCLLDDMALSGQVREQVLEFIAQKNVPGVQALADRGLITIENAQTIAQLMSIYAPLRQGIDQAGQLARNDASWDALRQLSLVASILEGFGLGDRVHLDFSLVNSMDYYNGVIFQGFLQNIPFPVLSGGRYDGLLGEFGCPLPATGFGVEVDALASAMCARGDAAEPKAADVLVFGIDGCEVRALSYARSLNAQGLVCENCVLNSAEAARDYAARKGIGRLDVVKEESVEVITINGVKGGEVQ